LTNTIADKILKNSMPEPNSGCWLWFGNANRAGYGLVYNTAMARQELAHRASYKCFKGGLDQKLRVCHSCDMPACVNPDHLWIGTDADNVNDKVRKGRAMRGTAVPSSRLTENEVAQIRRMGGSQQEIADRFGVCQMTISKIKRGETWRHVE